MKKLNFTFLLTVLMSMAGTTVFAHDFEVANADGVTIYYSKTSDTEVKVSCRGDYGAQYDNEYSGKVVIPESVTYGGINFSVTSIEGYAFSNCSGLTSVTIGNSVTSIGDCAFSGCSGLTSIIIPNSVTSIGDYAFSACRGLTSVTIPNSVTSIGNFVFQHCSGFTSIVIPNSVTYIGNQAFYGCTGLTSISVESGNTKYDSRNDCNAIILTSDNRLIKGCRNTIIPNSVTSIYSYAFSGCSGLTSIEIPNSVTNIGGYAFEGCSGLTSVTIPNSVTSIYNGAFNGCRLENVVVKNVSISVDTKAFSDATKQHAMLHIPMGTWGQAVYDSNWYVFNNIRETVMATDEASTSNAYTLMNANSMSYAVYDDINNKVNMIKSLPIVDENNTNNCWQLVEKEGKKCLYNIGARQYAKLSEGGNMTLQSEPVYYTLKDADNGICLGDDTTQWYFVANKNVSIDESVTAITSPLMEPTSKEYFTLDGKRVNKPQKGVNIVKLSDGTTKKVVIK